MKKTKNSESKLDKNNDSESVVSEDTLDDFTGGSNFYLEDGEFNDECGEEECDDWNMLHHSYSQAFKINLPGSIKYAIRSGTLHMGMDRFCERGRGYQGPGIGIAAIVTSHVEEAPRWDEFTVDQVVKDGDRYCIASAKEKSIEDPSLITVEHMSRRIDIRNRYRGYLDIGEPQYIGQFRSEDSRILHVAKALELFFSTYDAGVMTSKVLNIGIWRSSGYYNIFDGQARLDNCEIPKRPEDKGSAKLIILQNLMAVVFVILEKSNVKNEMFIMYPVSVLRISKFCEIDKKFEELEFGSKSKQLFQSIVRSTYHLHHTLLPVEFHGRGQLPLAMTAIIYSKFVPSANWSSLLVDLIFNQSSVYLTELSRLLEKPLESDFELSVKEIPEDVVIGVYRSKIKIAENAVPGETKEKLSLQDGVREFFSKNSVGIIELDNMFYAMWRDNKKYYLFNPLACDEKGVRVDSSDPESKHKYDEATACVTMSSCPLELLDLLLGDAEEEPVDTYAIHGIDVIYVKSGLMEDGSDEEVLYQKCKKDKGRSEKPADKCVRKVDSLPRAKKEEELFVDEIGQYPELMDDVENFVGSFDEIQEGDAKASEEDEKLSRCIDFDVNDIKKCRMFYNSRYKIVNPHRLRLKATKSCASKEFLDRNRGRQGLIAALGAMAQSQKSHIEKWTSSELDRIIESANDAYELLVAWILGGSEGDFDIGDDAEMEPADKAADAASQKLKRSGKGLEHMDLSMLPPAMKIGDAKFSVVSKMNVLEGDANPMANLGEALEKYFHHFDEMILENKRLFYGVWKSGDKYFVLNPYGSDKDGWRNQAYPAQLCVTDCLNELVNLLYGILEFNEYHFVLHFVKLAVAVAVEGEEEGQAELPEVQLPEIEIFERFKTQFLPVTDEDYIEVTAEKREEETQSEDLSEQQDDVQDKVSVKTGISKVTWRDEELKLTNIFEESPEPEPQKTPKRLNFSLVTGLIKVQMTEDQEKNEQRIEIYYEQLKYKHPPPFILPDKQNICNLLDNKKVTESVPSLVSRFSIDSKLIVKPKIDSASPDDEATISLLGLHERSKLITIPRHKYFLSISLPSGYTPIRAINEKFIRDKSEEEKAEEECKKKVPQKENLEEVSAPDEKPILPKIIPLGPCISTPKPKLAPKDCPDKEDGCPLTKCEREDEILNKLVCSTENLLFEMMIPDFQDPKDALKDKQEPCCPSDEEDADDECGCTGPVCKEPLIPPNKPSKSPCNECGFVRTSSDNIGIILGQCCLEPRATTEPCHYKPCFYASMLCVLAKVCVDAHKWSPQVIDRIVAAARKISTGTGRLRYKQSRRFRNVDILGARCDVTLRQVRYADPERYEPDCLRAVLDCFLTKDQTGIVVFANAAFAFWMTGEVYYLFDAYGCDADGRAMEAEGGACLMEICDFDTLVQRIEENTGEPFGKAYRLYTLKISHLEKKKKKRAKRKKKGFYCLDQERECEQVEEPISDCYDECMPDEDSDNEELIELVEWVTKESTEFPCLKMRVPGFAPVKNFNASAIEVEVLRNKITRPINAPFKIVKGKPKGRELLYDRKFYPGSALDGALDLVVMAWARVHEPTRWSIRTIQGLFASCLELCYDSVLASEDTSVPRMLDDLLDEFTVANYQFRAVLGPLHAGSLYAKAGWNLAMALEKLFEAKVYTGATIVCGDKHVGVMKRDDKFYAWWPLLKSKKLRIVVSRCMRDYLKLIVKELGQKEPMEFSMRIVTVSYAKLLAPHCSDIDGLHESLLPSSEIAEVLVPESKDYDLESLYRPTDKCRSPLYIRGVAAICDRDAVTEPLVKRCYFVALVALVLRRDIIQNPLPAMVDKVLEVAEATYKLIEKPKYHTDHVIKDLPLMNRIFNVRDRASELTLLLDDDGYVLPKKSLSDELSKKLRRFFDRHTAALLHLSNCSYGLWYSGATECYYLLDPYACDCKGRRTCARGKGCLSIFATLCELVKHISSNRYEHTSGFFLHSVHVEAVNELCAKKDELVREDPVWLYLDCHWSFWHELKARREGEEDKGNTPSTSEPPRYKNYLIEIPGKVYSLWGTVGAFDSDFGVRAGKAQAAICIAAIAMRNLSQPSDWCPAILDSAVVLGDHYYRDSNKDESNRCLNRFNLTECLRASPHKWKVKFSSEICGVLYSRGEQPNLAECVAKGLSRSKNLVLQCQRRFLTVLRTSDALYVVDPSWVGPPLYAKDHGAIYALRCNDERTLVYVLTKMLNTNESLELSITPIELSFCQESCDPTDSKYKNRILSKTHHSLPGRVSPSSHCQPLVCGDLVAPSEDSYLGYKYKLKLGLASDLEKPPKPKTTKPSLPTKRYSLADKERKLRVEVNKIRRQRTNHPKVVDVADRKAGGVDRAKLKRAVVLPPRRSFVKCETKELYGKYNASLKKPVYMGLLHPGDRDPDDERWPRPGPPGSNLFGQTKKHK